jgi:hypothetical protein
VKQVYANSEIFRESGPKIRSSRQIRCTGSKSDFSNSAIPKVSSGRLQSNRRLEAPDPISTHS